LPDARSVGGTFGFFTELNRNWPPIGLIDYIEHWSAASCTQPTTAQ
jgi:hypothetical protein